MKLKIKNIISFFLNKLFAIFPIVPNKIVFESGRDLIDGNAKAIYNYIKKNDINNYRTIWLVTKSTDVSDIDTNDYAYYNTLKGLYHLSTAKYLLKNQSIGEIITKKKGQIYIQLFHGNGVMKKQGYDVNEATERPVVSHAKDWDYYIANDENDEKTIRSATGYNGKIEILGMAAVDTVINNCKDEQKKQNVLKHLNINNSKKNILYAPTFRDYDLDKNIINIPIKELSKLKDYNIIIRLHPLVRTKVDKSLFNLDNFINGCNYPDVSDILAITDILITDYSSVFYEYMPKNSPIIFYPYDYDKYVALRGGFYVDYKKELPGPICYTEKELLNVIKKIDEIYPQYIEKRRKFNKKYNNLSDGKASERLVNNLINNKFK